MGRSQVVLVKSEAPTEVALSSRMSAAAWDTYCDAVWDARLDAHLHALYLSRVRRWMGVLSMALQFVVVVGSGGAFFSALSKYGSGWIVATTLVVAACAAFLQLSGLVGRVTKVAMLEEAWAVRRSFWNDAFRMLLDRRYLGPISTLQEPEAALRRVEAELGIPEWSWYVRRVQEDVIRTDRLARGQVA